MELADTSLQLARRGDVTYARILVVVGDIISESFTAVLCGVNRDVIRVSGLT